jgi:hypothetical protein
MKQRVQVTVLLLVIAATAWYLVPQLTGQESLLGDRGRRDRSEAPFQAGQVPVIGMATPGPMTGETFDRERVNIFRYEEDPVEKARKAEAARLKAAKEAEARKLKAQREREEAARKAREKAEKDRLAREQAERDRLARQQQADAEATAPEEPPRPEPPDFPYRYDGRVGPKGDAIAILRDRDEEFAYARAGQVVDDAFRVEQVGRLKLVLSFVDPLFADEFQQVPLRPEAGEIGAKPTARR